METLIINIPKFAMKSMARGLLLMAYFTLMWSGIASGSLAPNGMIVTLVTFGGAAIMFICYAVYFFKQIKRFQGNITIEEMTRGKRMSKRFGIIFGLECVCIPIAVSICMYFAHPDLIVPAIALVVGIHFFPMASVFNRKIDYYLGTWATLIAISAIVIIVKHVILPYPVIAMLGIGMAFTTTSYGIYMIRAGKIYLAG